MSQASIESFFKGKKKNGGPAANKRKKSLEDTPLTTSVLTPVQQQPAAPLPASVPTPVHQPTTPIPDTVLPAPESKVDSVPVTPTKFASPSKDLNLALISASKAKRARLGDLNQRLEKALKAQEERKSTAKKATRVSRARNAVPVPFPKDEETVPDKAAPPSPQLSSKSLVVEVEVVKNPSSLLVPSSPLKRIPASPTKPRSTVAKASPRRWAASQEYIQMAEKAAEVELKLPYKYKLLLEVFRSVEQIVSMKFNRREAIRVADLKAAVQTAMKRNYNDRYLTMIRTVFPQAYRFAWEQLRTKYGQKRDEYELQMMPSLVFREDMEAGVRLSDEKYHTEGAKAAGLKVAARDIIARRQIFTGLLYSMVHDQHKQFLNRQDPPLSLPETAITSWHADFDIESCLDVDMTSLPIKPDVVRFHTASDAFTASRNLFGVNRRLEEVLKEQADKDALKKEEEAKPQVEEVVSPSKMRGLEGLPPAVVKRILAKQKAKQIKAMTEKPEEKKEKEMLEELQAFGPLILNCLSSEKQRQSRAAVGFHPFLKFVSESHGRGKTLADTETMIRTLIKLAPDWLQIVTVRRVEYLKDKAGAPDSNAMRKKLKQLLEEKNKV